jgi:hypothetical protein
MCCNVPQYLGKLQQHTSIFGNIGFAVFANLCTYNGIFMLSNSASILHNVYTAPSCYLRRILCPHLAKFSWLLIGQCAWFWAFIDVCCKQPKSQLFLHTPRNGALCIFYHISFLHRREVRTENLLTSVRSHLLYFPDCFTYSFLSRFHSYCSLLHSISLLRLMFLFLLHSSLQHFYSAITFVSGATANISALYGLWDLIGWLSSEAVISNLIEKK